MENYSYLLLVVGILFITLIPHAYADHEASVAGEVVPLSEASLGHGENCDDVHWHGELNGKPDPNPDGCGHGIVTILPHDDNDESIVPEVKKEDEETGPSVWSKIGGFLGDVVDVVAQMFGAPPPKTIHDSVEIVEEASEGIAENIDTIEEYRESVPDEEDTLGIYDTSTDGLEEGSLSQRFFNWINSIGE